MKLARFFAFNLYSTRLQFFSHRNCSRTKVPLRIKTKWLFKCWCWQLNFNTTWYNLLGESANVQRPSPKPREFACMLLEDLYFLFLDFSVKGDNISLNCSPRDLAQTLVWLSSGWKLSDSRWKDQNEDKFQPVIM